MKNPKAYMEHKGMWFEVKILGHKRAWGHDRCVVIPMAGKGDAIVDKKFIIDSDKIVIK